MNKKKNEARLERQGKQFIIWQDDKDNWCYTYEELADINTKQKELQPAINQIYETVDERLGSKPNVQRKKHTKTNRRHRNVVSKSVKKTGQVS